VTSIDLVGGEGQEKRKWEWTSAVLKLCREGGREGTRTVNVPVVLLPYCGEKIKRRLNKSHDTTINYWVAMRDCFNSKVALREKN